MNLVILSLMKISALRCTSLTKEKGNCEEMKCKMKERKKEKESEENRGNQAFRPIMEQVLGIGLECSEGTSRIAQ